MRTLRVIGLVFVLLLPVAVFTQNADDAAKEKQRRREMVIDQIVTDLPNLTLGENRAMVSTRLGNLLWQTDEKRARAMFQTAISELVEAQTQAESRQTPNSNQNELATSGNTRPQILQVIANRDAEWALDLLAITRPAAIVKALAAAPPKADKISNSNNFLYLAQNERAMEQSFIRMAADQNPEKALKLIKDALAKDISNETLNLLKKLHQKEPESAKAIGSRIADKLIGGDFTQAGQPDHQKIQIAIGFISDTVAERGSGDKTFHFEISQMRSLADKVISFYLNQSGQVYLNYSIITIAEKLSPGSVETLKKLSTAMSGRNGFSFNPELQKLMNGSVTAEQMLAAAGKFTGFERNQIYQQAVNKLAQEGNMARATAVIKETYSEDAYDEAMRNLNGQNANRLMNEGKFADAELILDEMPEQGRLSALLNLANTAYNRDQVENKTYAMAVMQKARLLLSESPENNAEMSNLNQYLNTLANIDPPEAFRVFERMIPKLNELADAAAILYPFQGNGNVRRGEFVLSQGYSFGNFGADFSVINVLARKDFDQASKVVDQISRREMRIWIRLQLADVAGQ